MSIYSHNYNARHDLLSPQRKPLAGSLLKTYSHVRPTSALRTKNELERSPQRNESAKSKKSFSSKLSYPSATGKSFDSQSSSIRRRPEDTNLLSNSLIKGTPKWDKHLNIETSGDPSTYSNLNLKGYSVTNSNSSHRTVVPFAGQYTSKYSLQNNSTTSLGGSYIYPARNVTPPYRKPSPSPFTKERLPKGYGSGTSFTDSFTSSKNPSQEASQKEEKPHNFSQTFPLANKPSPFADEASHLPPFDPTKCSIKQIGIIKAYAVNTHQGIVRTYNEDRVSIILNIIRPAHVSPLDDWPLCSFFGVYDGHGGSFCADFLRDNLHQFVIQDKNFPKNPVEAIKRGFEEAENKFKEIAQSTKEIDRSGSCAIVALIVEDTLYIANVGDSRAVASFDKGKRALALSRDHKPEDRDEQKRITSHGGKIYQSQITQPAGYPGPKVIYGPPRVFPGRLSVSRTFGDIEAKLPKYGGNPYVVVAEPEIKSFKITKDWDYIVLASDGIYDKMETEDVASCIKTSSLAKENDIHKQTAASVERLMKESLIKKTMDNITVVMVAFSGFERMHSPGDFSEETRKFDYGTSQPLNKLNFNGQSHKSPEKILQSHHSPVSSSKMFSSVGNERPLYSATAKRYDTLTNSADYGGGHYKGQYWRTSGLDYR